MRCQFHQILSRSNTLSSAVVGLMTSTVNFSRILQRLPADLEDILGPVSLVLKKELKEIGKSLLHIRKYLDRTNDIRSHVVIGQWDSILFVLTNMVDAFTALEPLIGPLALTTKVGLHGLAKWNARKAIISNMLEQIRQQKQILILVSRILQW
jgi:hypothetical protein